ncbi:formylglycine-generating enzyme family protein [Vibrio maritimus]
MTEEDIFCKPINDLSDRAAMGLSKCYTFSNFDSFSTTYRSLINASPKDLVRIIESSSANIADRYCAGQILALIGDPRISVASPSMVVIPSKNVTLGLKYSKVDRVVEMYRDVGVLREWIMKECPEYTVQISKFGIGKYCVTNMEYRQFLVETQFEEIPTSWEFGQFPAHKSNHPVYTITPMAADKYCEWLSNKTGRAFRLPTEQEWEYVASNGVQDEFPWGNSFKSGHANTVEEGIFRSTPVGIYPLGASEHGVLDLAGNVEEYTSCDYSAYPNGIKVCDDLQASEVTYRVARGGSFTRYSDLARSKRRHGWYKKQIYVMGFRLAETL